MLDSVDAFASGLLHNFDVNDPKNQMQPKKHYRFYRLARSSDINKVLIQNDPSDDRSWSSVGNQRKGIQRIEIRDKDFNNRTVPHELLHAAGIYHEQARPDRDNYVEIIKFINSNRNSFGYYLFDFM